MDNFMFQKLMAREKLEEEKIRKEQETLTSDVKLDDGKPDILEPTNHLEEDKEESGGYVARKNQDN